MTAAPRITFLGATDTVTGSRYLVEHEGARVLVDCGLFQGPKKLRQRNWDDRSIDAIAIDAVILTHAHIDHAGYLPRLCKAGFRGHVYCTDGTADLLHVLLPDAGHLQEEEARLANREGYSRHRPALPLYTRADAEACLNQLKAVAFDVPVPVYGGITARFTRAGHIVGSACVRLQLGGVSLTFSGDVGRPVDPVMKPAAALGETDFLVVESTYGDRRHPISDLAEDVARVVNETVARGGTVVVPAFAVGRAQHLLHLLAVLKAQRRIPEVPVFLDSPMAIAATHLFCRHTIDHGLSPAACTLLCKLPQYSESSEESRAIDRRASPAIIISASGMATGGRVLHHLKRFLPDARSTILLVGYQAAGTRGRALIEGSDELKIHGQYVSVRAHIVQLQGLSAHADYDELIEWLARSSIRPRRVFVTHGEPAAADSMRRRITEELGWPAVVPSLGQTYALE
jgi:metallo-beta-lactamase family protein